MKIGIFLTLILSTVLLTVILSSCSVEDFNTIVGAIEFEEIEIEQNQINSIVKDNGDISAYFCPDDNCENAVLEFLDSAEKSIHCALYELDYESINEKIMELDEQGLDVKIIVDNNYIDDFYEFTEETNLSYVKTDGWGQMHNKFCIIDNERIFTGSMNPSTNGITKNNNNLLIINSEMLSANYENEFEEMWDGTFKKGDPTLNEQIILNQDTDNEILVVNYFCPEDNCAEHIKEIISQAQKSIHFMTFSFTHDEISNSILLKTLEGVEVKGIVESRHVSSYSEYQVMEYQTNVTVYKDANSNNMHHKVFIIDESIVITGSMNPSANGDESNDENVLIMHNEEIAQWYEEEFEKLFTLAKENSDYE